MLVPPYTIWQLIANSNHGLRAWLPQIRLWHGQGLLRRDGGAADDDAKTGAIVHARRQVQTPAAGTTRYDWFLTRLAEENRVEREAPRLIRAADCPWETTRQGNLQFYLNRWTETAASGLDVMAQRIDAGARSGEHRHIFEELLLVVSGRGYDLHEGTQHRWQAGDLICVPPMLV